MQTEMQPQEKDFSDPSDKSNHTDRKEEKPELNEGLFDTSLELTSNGAKLNSPLYATKEQEHQKDTFVIIPALQSQDPESLEASLGTSEQLTPFTFGTTAEESVAKLVAGTALILGLLKKKGQSLFKKEKNDTKLPFEKIPPLKEKVHVPIQETMTSSVLFPEDEIDFADSFDKAYFSLEELKKQEVSKEIIDCGASGFIDNFKNKEGQPIDWKTTDFSEVSEGILAFSKGKNVYNFQEFLKNIYLKLYQHNNTRFLSNQLFFSSRGNLGNFEKWLALQKVDVESILEAQKKAQNEFYSSTYEAHPKMAKKIWMQDLGENMGFTKRFLTSALQDVDWTSISAYEVVQNIQRVCAEDEKNLSESMIQDLYYKLYANENYGIDATTGWDKVDQWMISQSKDKNGFYRARQKALEVSQAYPMAHLTPFAIESYLMLDADKIDLETFKKGITPREKDDKARYPRLEVLIERMYDAKNPNLDAFCAYVIEVLGYPKQALQKKLYKKILAHEKTNDLHFEKAVQALEKQLSLKSYARKVAFFGEPSLSKSVHDQIFIMPSEFNLRRFKYPKKIRKAGVYDIIHDEKPYKGFKRSRLFLGHKKEYEMTHPTGREYSVYFDEKGKAKIKEKNGKKFFAKNLTPAQVACFFINENIRLCTETMDVQPFLGSNNPFIFGGQLSLNPDKSVKFVFDQGVHSAFFTDALGTCFAITQKSDNVFALTTEHNGREETQQFNRGGLAKELLKKCQLSYILQLRAQSNRPEDIQQIVAQDLKDELASQAVVCQNKEGQEALAFHIGKYQDGKALNIVIDGATLDAEGAVQMPPHLNGKEIEFYDMLLHSKRVFQDPSEKEQVPRILQEWQQKHGVRVFGLKNKPLENNVLWEKAHAYAMG